MTSKPTATPSDAAAIFEQAWSPNLEHIIAATIAATAHALGHTYRGCIIDRDRLIISARIDDDEAIILAR